MATATLPPAAAGTADWSARRAAPRLDCNVGISCKPPGANETRWDADLRDVSRGGFRLSLARRFERGTCLAVELPGRNGQEPYSVLVQVANVAPDGNGRWCLGCRMVGELSDDDLQRFVECSQDKKVAPAPRVITGVRLRVETAAGTPRFFRINRLHPTGAWPIPPGKTIQLNGINPVGGLQTFRVLHCAATGDGWELEVEAL
jgi:hypothetical protein